MPMYIQITGGHSLETTAVDYKYRHFILHLTSHEENQTQDTQGTANQYSVQRDRGRSSLSGQW